MLNHGLCQSDDEFDLQIPLGISIALSIRVGTYLGANEPACAKRAALVTTKLIGSIWY